jgi:hypothetical protein
MDFSFLGAGKDVLNRNAGSTVIISKNLCRNNYEIIHLNS